MSRTPQSLTSGPITAQLIRLAVPASVGMLFNTLYNLTDFWFAGLLSDQALAGVSVAGSVFFLILSIGFGMQTGVSAVVAPEVGRDRLQAASDFIDHAMGLALVLSLIVAVAGFFVSQPLVRFLGAEADIEPLANAYLLVTFLGTPAFLLSFVAAGALMAFGDTKSNRNALAVGFVLNFAINPLLTFVFGWGVSGLALATVIIKAVSAVYLFYVLTKYTSRRIRPRFDPAAWLELRRQVMPASFNMLTIILGGFVTVALIGRFGSNFIAGYAVGLRLEQVLLLPALGLNSAILAMAGQNFGAEKYDRVVATYQSGLRVGFVMAVVSIPIMVFLSPLMMSVFSSDPTIIATGATYLRIDAIAFFAYVVLFQSTACLQAIKQPLFPMVLGIARQLVVPAAINYLLIVHMGFPMVSVFYTIIITVLIAACISHFYTRRRLQLQLQGLQSPLPV